ncbi:hypothetical protein [Roseobacter sp. HKCCA0882]|uniref:hypothetical protein n=1 Tax=Roseobacter sp. HKCCA0882 TaxID=3120337 RepID=UPI0030EE23D4
MTIGKDNFTVFIPYLDKRLLGHMFSADQSEFRIRRMVAPWQRDCMSRCDRVSRKKLK